MAANVHAEDSSTEKAKLVLKTLPSDLQEEWNLIHELVPESRLCIKGSKRKKYIIIAPLHVQDEEFVFHFRLTESYPLEAPEISLASTLTELSESKINNALKPLRLICDNSIGQPMLVSCIQEALNHFQNHTEQHRKNLGSKKKETSHKKQRKKNLMETECATSGDENISYNSNSEEFILDSPELLGHAEKCLPTSVNNNNPKPLRPNYFIAIRITNQSLIRNLVTIQNALVEQEDLLSKGVIPASALHITLCNLGLDKADDLLRAMEALRKMKLELQSMLPRSSLIIHGASQFYDRAIFAKVKRNDEFTAFRDKLIQKLDESGVEFRDDHENYTPHLTLVKVRRPERRMFGSRPIRPQIYSSFLESVHGEQMIDAIFLCAMDGNKREDGFYVTPYEIEF